MASRTTEYLQGLVNELSKLSNETEWVEFKVNNKEPEMIARYISGLSNAATLCGKSFAYMIWGVDDDSHNVVGTEFEYRKMKKGGEELESWLTRMINPKIDFRFFEVFMDDNIKVIILEIPRAEGEPTKFGAISYIRVGSSLQPLVNHKEKEAELWRAFDTTLRELCIAAHNLTEDEVVRLLDYSKYYDKLELPIPRNREEAGLIRTVEQNAAPRHRKYIPYWA